MNAADVAVEEAALVPAKERHVLVLDLSKSMLAPLPDPQGVENERQKIEVARTAVYRILENAAHSGAAFGLVTFTETVRVAVPLTEIRPENLPYVESLISMLTPSGRSAIWDALALGSDLLRSGNGAVRGNLVLVTDGWDNASQRFAVRHPDIPDSAERPNRQDLVAHMLPEGSELTLRVIGIGSGAERDKGVDAGRIHVLIGELQRRSRDLLVPASFSFQEVVTGSQLFSEMVQAFVDVGYDDVRPIDQLHPEELARHAASAAKALKEPQAHATVGRIGHHYAATTRPPENGSRADANLPPPPPPPGGANGASVRALEVDVLTTPTGAIPPNLRERYGPLGSVVESFLSADYETALQRLTRAQAMLPAVTRFYWEARIQHARGQVVDAARALLEAWTEADRLPLADRGRIVRRLALLQARLQNDKETETLVHFLDDIETRLSRLDPKFQAQLGELFSTLMELRGTYQLSRLGVNGEASDGAMKHEEAVEKVFARLQDARLENTSGDPGVEGALDFVEICLAEMR
jgi:hypothetical protein